MAFETRDLLFKVKSYIETAAADTVILSPGFFRGFFCAEGCGACCRNVSLEFFADTQRWEDFKTAYSEHVDLFEKKVDRDSGVEVMVYSNSDHKDRYCRFLRKTDGRCNVHTAAPFPCRFAPVKFIDRRDTAHKSYLNASGYGRVWAFTRITGEKGGACEVLNFDLNKFKRDVIMLEELREYGSKMQIPSKLKYIVEYLNENMKAYEEGLIPSQPIEFTGSNVY